MQTINMRFGDLAINTPFTLEAGVFIFKKTGVMSAERIGRPDYPAIDVGEAVRVRPVFASPDDQG